MNEQNNLSKRLKTWLSKATTILQRRVRIMAFYGATAVLLNGGLDFSKHSGVIASIHQRFVKTGKLSKEQGKDLNWLFEIRNVGDYGGTAHVSQPQAERAIQAAESFLRTIKSLLNR
ncbi:MAG TPA: HEPN domain-containing protein [Syntrophales bacterium]|nr:HEPN domain-containing protein [Syntrophales bacterium]